MRGRGYSLEDIAAALKRGKSAVWYELSKRRKGRKYDAAYAKHLSYVRMRAKRKNGKKIALDPLLRDFVETQLKDDQSPEAIEGRLKRVPHIFGTVSAYAIRRFIESPYGRKIEAYRKRVFGTRRRTRTPKAKLDGKRMISKRPLRIAKRQGLGHM